MKKLYLLLILSFFVGTAYAVYERTDETPYSPQFNLRMHYCIPINDTQFTESGKTIRRILGFENHLCKYAQEDYDSSNNMIKKTSCTLNIEQRIQFIQAVKDDMEGKGPAKQLFESFQNNPDICKIEDFSN